MVDKVEDLARDRLKELFGAEHANVQPHSGAQANSCGILFSANYGDTVMGMDLSTAGISRMEARSTCRANTLR